MPTWSGSRQLRPERSGRHTSLSSSRSSCVDKRVPSLCRGIAITSVGGRTKISTQVRTARHSSELIAFVPGLDFECPACGYTPENRGFAGETQKGLDFCDTCSFRLGIGRGSRSCGPHSSSFAALARLISVALPKFEKRFIHALSANPWQKSRGRHLGRAP